MHGPLNFKQDTVRSSPNTVPYTMFKGRQILRTMCKCLLFIITKSVR